MNQELEHTVYSTQGWQEQHYSVSTGSSYYHLKKKSYDTKI